MLRLHIRETIGQSETGIFYKNVDICDLPSIMSKGILSMDKGGNNNWESDKRANNATDVVYLFRPTGYENSFVNYGVALLEVEVDGVENEILDHDVNKGKYKEYICDCVPPENIRAIYIPEIFKDRVKFRHPKLKWCGMEAKVFSSELYDANREKYGTYDKFTGRKQLWDVDYDESTNYMEASDELLDLFAKTANINCSSDYSYFTGVLPNNEVFNLDYIHYDI
jgi:hypothetical protein